jgi:hypothetical protein
MSLLYLPFLFLEFLVLVMFGTEFFLCLPTYEAQESNISETEKQMANLTTMY